MNSGAIYASGRRLTIEQLHAVDVQLAVFLTIVIALFLVAGVVVWILDRALTKRAHARKLSRT